jgi:hypothetical protein
MVYVEPILFALVQEGVLREDPDLSASVYARNLIFADLKARQLLTPEIMESLVTGRPLKPPEAA